tara:strand:+ start:165 stop:485 length:321 start_codon:yes stop_codon:yes gene_type:complete
MAIPTGPGTAIDNRPNGLGARLRPNGPGTLATGLVIELTKPPIGLAPLLGAVAVVEEVAEEFVELAAVPPKSLPSLYSSLDNRAISYLAFFTIEAPKYKPTIADTR